MGPGRDLESRRQNGHQFQAIELRNSQRNFLRGIERGGLIGLRVLGLQPFARREAWIFLTNQPIHRAVSMPVSSAAIQARRQPGGLAVAWQFSVNASRNPPDTPVKAPRSRTGSPQIHANGLGWSRGITVITVGRKHVN